jgi:predicted phosphodiesterase
MKVVHISDTHGLHEHLLIPRCDLLIHSGDIGGRTTLLELEKFLDWFARQPARRKIFIAGNHDIVLDNTFRALFQEEKYKQAMEMIESYRTQGVHYLKDSGTTFRGYKIWGSPYSPSFHREYWVFNADRGDEIQAVWNKIPKDTDILITHTPTYMVLDDLRELKRKDEEANKGCANLGDTIRRKITDLKLHCSGHLHSNYGVVMEKNWVNDKHILYSNGAVLDNNYDLTVSHPLIITV